MVHNEHWEDFITIPFIFMIIVFTIIYWYTAYGIIRSMEYHAPKQQEIEPCPVCKFSWLRGDERRCRCSFSGLESR